MSSPFLLMGSVTHLQLAPFLERISRVNPTFNKERVLEAYEYASEIYAGDMHMQGVSTLEHVTGILEVLAPFEPDEDAIIACLLHHVLLVDSGSLAEIEEKFGPTIRSLVSSVHMLTGVTLHGRRQSIDDLRIMLLSVSDDVRTILIALCDRCYVLQNVDKLPKQEAQRLASDVLNLFAPVAARLGIYALKHELERRAFPICYPSDAERIAEQVDALHTEKGDFLPHAAEELTTRLKKHGFDVSLEFREKQTYSIFRKMRAKSFSHIEDLRDLFAIRVIVDSVEDCYRVLGIFHQIGHPIAHRFKDFIAFPKPNGYQSLHTSLVKLPGVPKDTCIELQVRTKRMHREASFGIAAHWSYKEYGSTARAVENVQLKRMLSGQETVGESSQSFADHIFVMTPNGDIIELPEGATPLDFAFQVHTELGLSFRSAMVNGSIVAMDYELENGDVVEIQKNATPQPSPSWMGLLKMTSSRSKLKRHLYSERRDEFVSNGKDRLNAELEKFGLPSLDRELSILKIFDGAALSHVQREDLLMKIGQDTEKVSQLLYHLDAIKDALPQKQQTKRPVRGSRLSRKITNVVFDDNVPMPTRLAKCCKPSAEDDEPIVGLINRNGEVMIHRKRCRMIRNANAERKVGVSFA